MTEKPLAGHRTCTIALRKMREFPDVFNRLAVPVLLETLGRPLGFWTGVAGQQNQLIHLSGYDDFADSERRSQARDRHPSFPAYRSASAHLTTAQEIRIIRAPGMQLHIPGWSFQ